MERKCINSSYCGRGKSSPQLGYIAIASIRAQQTIKHRFFVDVYASILIMKKAFTYSCSLYD